VSQGFSETRLVFSPWHRAMARISLHPYLSIPAAFPISNAWIHRDTVRRSWSMVRRAGFGETRLH